MDFDVNLRLLDQENYVAFFLGQRNWGLAMCTDIGDKLDAEMQKGNQDNKLYERLRELLDKEEDAIKSRDALLHLWMRECFRHAELKKKYSEMSFLLIEMLKDEQQVNGFPGYKINF